MQKCCANAADARDRRISGRKGLQSVPKGVQREQGQVEAQGSLHAML